MLIPAYQVSLIVIVIIVGAALIVLNLIRARARLAETYAGLDQAYQKITQESVDAQRKAAENQEKTVACLAELRDRITAIEKLLREVS